jgi:hypothetical protein
MPWSARFDDPIPLPRGRQFVTLRDAAEYITMLPKAEHDAPEWQTAMEALLLAELGGPTMFARIGLMRALNRHVERVFNADRERPALGTAEAGAGSMTQGNAEYMLARTCSSVRTSYFAS